MITNTHIFFYFLFCFIVIVLFALFYNKPKLQINKSSQKKDRPILRSIKKESGLNSDILKEGIGKGAENGNHLTVHYEVFLENGKKVDSSYDRGKTLTFRLGHGEVIPGWDDSLSGSKKGELRKVVVPAKFAYGKKGSKTVPPDSTLIFEIEVVKIAV